MANKHLAKKSVNDHLIFHNCIMFITGAIAKTSFYVEYILPHIIFNMSCNGDEDSIYNCTYSSELPSGSNCYSGEDASVICQGNLTYTSNCFQILSLRVLTCFLLLVSLCHSPVI